MAQPQRWWVGLLLLVPFWLVVGIKRIPVYESDVARRAMPAVAQASKQVVDPNITVAGRDVRISGTQISNDGGSSAVAAVEAVPGVRLASQDMQSLAVRKPYVFAAERAGSTITLTGFVPSPEIRVKLVAAAKAAAGPNGSVEDTMQYGGGAGPGFEAQALFGLGLAGQLTAGSFVLSDDTASLQGTTADSATYGKLRAAINTVPSGGKTGTVRLTPPSAQTYSFSAAHEGNRIALSGLVPTAAARTAVNEAARVVAGVTGVDDRLNFASGAPDKYGEIAAAGIALAGVLKSGLFSYRAGVADLSGEAPDSATYDRVRAAMRKLPGETRAGNVRVTPPAAATYVFSASHNGSSLVLAGNVPSTEVRARLIAIARKTGKPVKDAMSDASGAVAGFEDYAARGIQAAATLANGLFTLNGATFDLSGDAATIDIYNAVRRDVVNFPRNMKPGTVDIRPPLARPFAWRAERKGDTITLRGAVPDEAARAEIERRAKELFPGAAIANAMVVARGAPKLNFVTTAVFGLRQLANLLDGNASLTDDVLSVSGRAPDFRRGETVRGLAGAKLPQGLRLGEIKVTSPPAPVTVPMPPSAPVIVPPPPPQPAPVAVPAPPPPPSAADACKRDAAGSIATALVYFPYGRHRMLADSEAELARIVEKAKTCANAGITLHGHADARGGRRANIWLSTRRTFTVKRQLVRTGVDGKRVQTLGFGKDRPANENLTSEGRAKNRRVEIILK